MPKAYDECRMVLIPAPLMLSLPTATAETMPTNCHAILTALSLMLAVNLPATARDSAAKPPPGQRNLFAELGFSASDIRQKTATAFEQIFYGNPTNEAVYYPAGTNHHGALAYIFDFANQDVRSEGMSYGMMIAVQLDKKPEFDALWNWSRSFMYHSATNHPAQGYFAWSLTTNGVANDEMPAADGEEYYVTALFFAAARWGNGKGIFNYQSEARRILADLKNRTPITGPTAAGEKTGGALFSSQHKMVRFTPDTQFSEHTDPSYHLPAFYELWARWAEPADRAFWHDAANVSREFFQRAAHPLTGLTPDYANFDGTPWAAPWKPESADFRFDAWRTAMNWAVDWTWWNKDPREKVLSERLLTFFESQGMTNYVNQYSLAGQPLSADRSTGLVAMNAVAALAATDEQSKQFGKRLWDARVPSGPFRYYDGLLYLMALLHCSGEFRAWELK